MSAGLRLLLSLAVLAAATLSTWFLWIKGLSLTALLLTYALSCGALVALYWEARIAKFQADEPRLPLARTVWPSRWGWILAGGGVLFVGGAWGLVLINRMGAGVACLFAAAACWMPLLDSRPAAVPRRWEIYLIVLAIAVGAWMRLYQAGDVPNGMITVDEPRLIMYAHEILDGKRETYNMRAAEGQIPFYLSALAMKVFGQDINGFRMASIFSGILMIGLMALCARELAGPRVGLAAAAFSAVAVWTVTFSRTEYLMAASYLPILSSIWLFLRGLRLGSGPSLVLAGFSLGLCFNVYQAGKLTPLLVLILATLGWIQRPDWRPALRQGAAPFLAGFLASLLPLILWALQDLKTAYFTYFAPLFAGFAAGEGVHQAQGFFAKVDGALGRILPELPKVASMYSTRGPMRPWYFMADQPVVSRDTLFFFLAGLSVCLARFRKPAFALLVIWWFVGLTPTLVSNPQLNMDERRVMLGMPAAFFIASLGLVTVLELAGRGLASVKESRLSLGLGLLFFTFLGVGSWHTYFHVIMKDKNLLEFNHANFDNGTRAVFKEERKSPVYLLSFRKPNIDAWSGPNAENELDEHFQVLKPIPRVICQYSAQYFHDGGLFGLLGSLPAYATGSQAREPLVLLTPFHYYLESFLVGQLGGERVQEVKQVISRQGPSFKDMGFARENGSVHRLVRLKNFQPGRIEALKARWMLPFTAEELAPPRQFGTAEQVRARFIYEPGFMDLLKQYDENPQSWKVGRSASFAVPDAYFWITANNLPGQFPLPLRLKAHWILEIPADGEYALGAASSCYLSLKVDGKKVFSYLPRDAPMGDASYEGYLGEPVFLKAGPHRLDLDQVMFSPIGNFNHALRLVWKRPGADKESLPLEALSPPAAGPKP